MNESHPTDEYTVRALYQQLLDSWNRRNGADFAAFFSDDALVVGFDGSQMNGRVEIGKTLSAIFADHVTLHYVGIVRNVWQISPDTMLLHAEAGMIAEGKTDFVPERNTVQTLVVTRHGGEWQIAMYQNTPAQFHGRPDLAAQLLADLRAAMSEKNA